MEPDDCYHQHLSNSDEQPKDLTVKTVKKMKPIPPPLNLNGDKDLEPVPMTLLKEFANFATSPKSPLMLKHLPFRKRYSLFLCAFYSLIWYTVHYVFIV